MKEFTDKEIVEGILDRDGEVFEYLMNKYRKGIKLMVYQHGGSSVDGEDVFSDGILTLIKVVERRNFLLTCKLSTLLYSICDKKWKQVLDKQRAAGNYRLRHNESNIVDDFSEDIDYKLYSGILWGCFEKLEKECRRILKAYLREIPAREIADLLDYSYGNLRKKKSMCHTSLRSLIYNHPDYMEIRDEVNL